LATMRTIGVLALAVSVCGKIVGLHDGASEKFKEHMLDKIIASRVEVLEGLEINREHTSGPSSLHVIEPGSTLDKHFPVIELRTASRGVIYVHGGWDNETHAPTHNDAGTEHPMPKYHDMKAMYVKDESGAIVHLSEFHEHTKEGDLPHVEFDVPASATTLTPYAFSNLHGLWQGHAYTVSEMQRKFLKEDL